MSKLSTTWPLWAAAAFFAYVAADTWRTARRFDARDLRLFGYGVTAWIVLLGAVLVHIALYVA